MVQNKNISVQIENNMWKISDIAISILLELFLSIGFAIIISGTLPNKIVYLISTVVIHFIVILYLKNKYQINIFVNIEYWLVVKYSVIGVLLCSVKHVKYYYWLINHNHGLPEYTIISTFTMFSKICYLLIICALIPLVEEIIFRGYFFTIIKNKYNNVYFGVIMSTIIFTAFHSFFSNDTNMLDITLQGLIYVYIFHKSKSIWASFITHSFNNAFWFLLTFIVLK